MARKPLTLDDLEKSLRILLCQPCGIVAKPYVVRDLQWYCWIRWWRVTIGLLCLSAAV